MKPFVGVTCAWSEETGLKNAHSRSFNYIEAKYQEAVYRYGGVPVLIPPPREDAPDLDGYAEEVLCRVDALYFTGGAGGGRGRLDGKHYDLYEQQPVRAAWEDRLLQHAYRADIPCLGACRGHQRMAQALGGAIDPKIHQEHRQQVPDHEGYHEIVLDPDSLLARIAGSESWLVNSLHNQIVLTAPEGFRVGARTRDGCIESIEAVGKRFFLGTQFHPEMMLFDERAKRLLAAFLAEAGK